MPDWKPNWNDVVFDREAALEAADACRGGAREAEAVVEALVDEGRAAVEDWTGRYRDDFDGEELAVRRDLDVVRGELLRLATALDAAAESAMSEQRHRESERERWREETRAEVAKQEWVRVGGGRIPR